MRLRRQQDLLRTAQAEEAAAREAAAREEGEEIAVSLGPFALQQQKGSLKGDAGGVPEARKYPQSAYEIGTAEGYARPFFSLLLSLSLSVTDPCH